MEPWAQTPAELGMVMRTYNLGTGDTKAADQKVGHPQTVRTVWLSRYPVSGKQKIVKFLAVPGPLSIFLKLLIFQRYLSTYTIKRCESQTSFQILQVRGREWSELERMASRWKDGSECLSNLAAEFHPRNLNKKPDVAACTYNLWRDQDQRENPLEDFHTQQRSRGARETLP